MSVATINSRREKATVLEPRRGRRSKDELRAEYRTIRNKFLRWFGKDEVDAAIRCKAAQLMVDRGKRSISPELWVDAIKMVTMRCDHCDGHGQWIGGGTINGKPIRSGRCFRCHGGRMTADDCERCANWHNNQKVA